MGTVELEITAGWEVVGARGCCVDLISLSWCEAKAMTKSKKWTERRNRGPKAKLDTDRSEGADASCSLHSLVFALLHFLSPLGYGRRILRLDM